MKSFKNKLESLIEKEFFLLEMPVTVGIYSTYIEIIPDMIYDQPDIELILMEIERVLKTHSNSYEVITFSAMFRKIRVYNYDISYFEKLIIFS